MQLRCRCGSSTTTSTAASPTTTNGNRHQPRQLHAAREVRRADQLLSSAHCEKIRSRSRKGAASFFSGGATPSPSVAWLMSSDASAAIGGKKLWSAGEVWPLTGGADPSAQQSLPRPLRAHFIPRPCRSAVLHLLRTRPQASRWRQRRPRAPLLLLPKSWRSALSRLDFVEGSGRRIHGSRALAQQSAGELCLQCLVAPSPHSWIRHHQKSNA